MNKLKREIRVIGTGSYNNKRKGFEKYKTFYCFGGRNADKACSFCLLRFQCFTDREVIEIPIKTLHKRTLDNVTAGTIAKMLVPVGVDYTKEGKRVRLDFDKLVTIRY